MRDSMSATGSVNLIVCFSSSRPFAPRVTENLSAAYSLLSLVVSRWSLVAGRQDQQPLPTTPATLICRCRRTVVPNDQRQTTDDASTTTTSTLQESRPATPVPGNTVGRCRTCGDRPADARKSCSDCACATKTSGVSCCAV